MDDEDDMDDADDEDVSCACSIDSRALSGPALCSNPSTLPIILSHEVFSGIRSVHSGHFTNFRPFIEKFLEGK